MSLTVAGLESMCLCLRPPTPPPVDKVTGICSHLNALKIDSAVGNHVDEVMRVLLVQKDVDSNVSHGSVEDIMKDVNIRKHVHHYGNHLRM